MICSKSILENYQIIYSILVNNGANDLNIISKSFLFINKDESCLIIIIILLLLEMDLFIPTIF
jgi:hypothetical protein